MDLIEKPLSFGRILDMTFRMVKNYFGKLYLFPVALHGPCYVLILLAFATAGIPLITDPDTQFFSLFESRLAGSPEIPTDYFSASHYIIYGLGMFLLTFIAIPVSTAAVIIATGQIRQNQTPDFGPVLKQAFSRYWALLGGSIVYGLICFAIIVGVIIILTLTLGLSLGLEFLADGGLGGADVSGGKMLSLVLLGIAGFAGVAYVLVRWSFFFPAIVFEKVSPGIGKSWRLTRRSFWRVFGLYLVITITLGLISLIVQALLSAFLGNSVLATLVSYLITMLIYMMTTVAYAVTYFDLRIRNEAADLKEILSSYNAQDPGNALFHHNASSDQNNLPDHNDLPDHKGI